MPELTRLFASIAHFTKTLGADTDCQLTTLHDVFCAMSMLSAEIGRVEMSGLPRDEIRLHLEHVRQIVAMSGWVRRIQTWPRGYAGDFETIEQVVTSENREVPGTLNYWIEQASLNQPIVQQHRNKIRVQAELLIDACARKTDAPRILVLACGSAPDVRRTQKILHSHRAELVLNDGDLAALDFVKAAIQPFPLNIITVHGNVIRCIKQFQEHGPYDLIMAGGLFDYLPDKHAVFLLRVMRSHLLNQDGRFFFTNIVRPNPYRWFMEYFSDWFLIERTEEEIRRLATEAGVGLNQIQLTREETGLAWLATIDAAP